jgi:hypothetical protein
MKSRLKRITTKSQSGFAFLMVLFLTTLVLLGAMAAAPYIRTEVQREKEQEMIWRGKQYVRGVKLYYRKMGRFPTSVDDLTKPKLGSLRFMRQAYKDPMNKGDGSWRFIYVGPSGQLIGSLKPQQTFQMPGVGAGQLGAPGGANAQPTTSFGASGFGQSPSAGQPGFPQNQQAGANQNGATNPGQPVAQPATGNATGTEDAANANGSGLLSDSPVIGGNIIGVGSKINKRSVIIYDKAKNYRMFEFVWNPSKDMANALNQQIGAPNQNQQGAPQGQTGFGAGQQQNNQQNNAPANQQPNSDMPLPTPPEPVPTPPPQQ